MNSWVTKFKPVDRVITKDVIGTVDTLTVGTFLNHAYKHISNEDKAHLRENESGYYAIFYEVLFNNGEEQKFYNEEDLTMYDSSPYLGL